MKKYPGGTSEEIYNYAKYQVDVIRPARLILVGGTNDIGCESKDGVPNEYKIVDNLINTGTFAQEWGATEFFISSVVCRRGWQYANAIKRINSLLFQRCIDHGFIYLDQSNITMQHISMDGLHLNHSGLHYMKLNLLKCFHTFNPFLCDFNVVTADALNYNVF